MFVRRSYNRTMDTYKKKTTYVFQRKHLIPDFVIGEKCLKCGKPASHKIEEVIESANEHPFTAYLCCSCFVDLFGNAASNSCGIYKR